MVSASTPARAAHRSGGHSRCQRPDLVQAVGVLGQRAQVHQLLGEQHVEHAQEQVGVAAGADLHVLGGQLGGLGAARVHHHDRAAPAEDPAQAVAHPGRRHDRAVGHRRVGAQHEHVLACGPRRGSGTWPGCRTSRPRSGAGAAGRSTWPTSCCWCPAPGAGPGTRAPTTCARRGCPGRWPRRHGRGRRAPGAGRRRRSPAPRPTPSPPSRRRCGAPAWSGGRGPRTGRPARRPWGRCTRARTRPRGRRLSAPPSRRRPLR